MVRIWGSVEGDILELLSDGKPRSMRQIQRELGRQWYTVYYHLKEKEKNLIARGCVEEERVVAPTENRAQDMYRYRITQKGLEGCPL
ncbi:hypothetical protein DRP07_00270 [Archaeoglobales archaeon]|nr:MAG: hypothetical protein DRP07_00270 [Archaeoglobales archaeon]